MSVPLDLIPAPHDASALTLVDQLVQWARRRIEEAPSSAAIKMGSLSRLFKRRIVQITETAR